MRTLSKGRVWTRIAGNVMNLIVVGIVGLAIAGCSGEQKPSAPKERVVSETKQARLPEAYRFGDISTLSMISPVDKTTTSSIRPVSKEAVEKMKFVEPTPGSDEYWLAKGVYFEARSEPFVGQVKVAATIIVRAFDRRWPKTIKAVISQGENKRNGCQYSFMCDGKPEQLTNQTAWQQAVQAAKTALKSRKDGVDMGCAHSYRATYVKNKKALRWFASLREETQIGTHIFYCDNDNHS